MSQLVSTFDAISWFGFIFVSFPNFILFSSPVNLIRVSPQVFGVWLCHQLRFDDLTQQEYAAG